MNVKKNIFIISFIILSFIFIGCCTTRTTADTIATNQRAIGRLESTAETIDGIINSSADRIRDVTERSKQMEDAVDRIIYLFGEYDKENRRIIDQLVEERDILKSYIKDNVDID